MVQEAFSRPSGSVTAASNWSERQDSNLRHPGSRPGTLARLSYSQSGEGNWNRTSLSGVATQRIRYSAMPSWGVTVDSNHVPPGSHPGLHTSKLVTLGIAMGNRNRRAGLSRIVRIGQ